MEKSNTVKKNKTKIDLQTAKNQISTLLLYFLHFVVEFIDALKGGDCTRKLQMY